MCMKKLQKSKDRSVIRGLLAIIVTGVHRDVQGMLKIYVIDDLVYLPADFSGTLLDTTIATHLDASQIELLEKRHPGATKGKQGFLN